MHSNSPTHQPRARARNSLESSVILNYGDDLQKVILVFLPIYIIKGMQNAELVFNY